ncbi:hypothetical protein [Prosthecobacter sp.]|uniref:hypothetical protein n=1 Tax=Prosthecobacter sp. TaxID=1965333 RepID=UPI002AB83635|nr:hypothetical protein [Prosthecobacter sp.]MDZ4403999.1 hypothetical protein [Prosthecobacter sp.]
MTPRGFIIVGIVAFLVWIVGAIVIWQVFPRMETRGQFGDMFGALTSLFSVASFIGVLIALHVQQVQVHEANKVARETTQAGAFKAVFDIIQDPKFVDARDEILRLRKQRIDWAATDSKAPEVVCKNYNTVGVLCREQYVKLDIVAAVWGRSIIDCWKKVGGFVEIERCSDPFFAKDYEGLVKQVESLIPQE